MGRTTRFSNRTKRIKKIKKRTKTKGDDTMIKPIDLTRKRSFGYINWYSDRTEERPGVQVLEQKINEMIEAINYLLTRKDKK